jgi:p-cumate 2,3-dioxygenase subunit alpha
MGLKPVPRFESYRGMLFVSFAGGGPGLVDYLGRAREYLDYMLDFGESELEVVTGTQKFSMSANWKLLVENSIDPYHALSTHRRYFRQYLPDIGLDNSKWLNWDPGIGIALDNGHTLIEFPQSTTPLSEGAKAELAAVRAQLVAHYGEERAHRIADFDRNMFIFPNLVLISLWRSVRTFFPLRPDYVEINEWALMPRTDPPNLRLKRLESFMSFLGPAGFGAPDDVSALEGCQRGFAASGDDWSDLSRNMTDEVPPASGELQQRGFWRRWRALTNGEHGPLECADHPVRTNVGAR